MKANIFTITGTKTGDMELPFQFEEPIRKDLIKRAVLAVRSNNFQPHGTDPLAGAKQGAAMPKRRKKYKGTYGKGISRVRRKVMWRRGLHFAWQGAFTANAVGGRKAYPPMVEKVLTEKINVQERRKAIRSALAATADKKYVLSRHKADEVKSFPLIVEDKIENIKKSKDVKEALEKLGLEKELARTSESKIRAGKGKMRGRRYVNRIGPLIVVSKKCDIIKSGQGLSGVDVISVESLNAELLAPGTQPGRLTIWSQSAIERLSKERLFE